ncbi:hypothetical protein ACROSR_13990 [Roseovarius tibetensis]|uniref:hypothetical protein n=1 Tax=Roseovarius tibetensis TaxID=2685897 RepID=UPI003D7FC170
MSRSAITIRNRANAAKSTGPRSAAGKATVAQNAQRHGVTAQPDPERVASWMRIILDTPDLGPGDLFADDTRTRSALALAGAEARLAEATRALEEFEAGTAPPSDVEEALTDQIIEFRAMLAEMPMSAREQREGLSLIRRLQKAQIRETRPGGRRHCLLKRYFREARAQRKRAFQDWLACIRDHQPAQPSESKTFKIPKQSQISP